MTDALDLADRTVAVTGHTGFLGAWTCGLALAAGARVVGLGRRAGGGVDDALGLDGIERIVADIADPVALADVLGVGSPDLIVHTAAVSTGAAARADRYGAFVVNALGTAAVIEAARRAGVRSVAVAETWFPVPEAGPVDPYVASKAAARLAARSIGGDDVGVARVVLPNLVGGGDAEMTRLVPDAIASLQRGDRPVARTPEHLRRWVHVLDGAASLLEAGMRTTAGEVVERNVYDVAPEVSAGDLVARLDALWHGEPSAGGPAVDGLVWGLDEALRRTVEAGRDPDRLADIAAAQVADFVRDSER